MRSYIFIVIVMMMPMMLLNTSAEAQQKSTKKKQHYGKGQVVEAPPAPKIFTSVVQLPEFPGGTAALNKYMHDNLRYPPQAREDGVQGNVVLSFFVNEDGSIGDVAIEKGIGSGCDKEAIRVLSGMPKWKPYKREGHTMKMLYDLKIEFRLTE